MRRPLRDAACHATVLLSGFVVGVCLLAIALMALAAIAFTGAVTTGIPFVVMFTGERDAGGSPAVVIDGSFASAMVLVLIFAVGWWAVARAVGDRRSRVRPASTPAACS
ncbi:hypothetical protein ACIPVB_02055 [Microbacterium sp. NPDC090007]|uniref:hypothetical protein n=1 Tax=Microbacterium sp. NPDC090007 TaxID=3364204 RepID=UPI00381DE921